MHFLAGVTVALGYITLLGLVPRLADKNFTLLRTLVFVIMVASAWEVFELAIGVQFEEGTYVGDTTLDIVMGILGGLAGYFVGRRVSQLDV